VAQNRIIAPYRFDLTEEVSLADAAVIIGEGGSLDLMIVAVGMLHRADMPLREKLWRAIDLQAMVTQFAINTIGLALAAKHMLSLLRRNARIVSVALSAWVGSIDDSRMGGWHRYCAPKAALNMLVDDFAIELATRNSRGEAIAVLSRTGHQP